jgi:Cu(I)/Ag(I) efflux system membrane fusion protein
VKRAIYPVLVLLVAGAAYVAGSWHGKKSGGGGTGGARKILYYVDPMHPAYKSDKPGIAPDCGMQLEPVYEDGSTGGAGDTPKVPGTVSIDPAKQQAVGLQVGTASKSSVTGTLRLLGRVAPDERRLHVISALVDGRVVSMGNNSTGAFVRKGEMLATFYAPEAQTASQAFVIALIQADRGYGPASAAASTPQAQAALLRNPQQYEATLRNLGMGDAQIEKIVKDRVYLENVDIVSPIDGIILVRNITGGLRFVKGTELYRIADLGRVWILVDVYEREGRLLKPGTRVRAISPNQGREFPAVVSEVLPGFDASTRTLKVRLAADNPGFLLRPDMFVDIEVPARMPPAVNVPAEAVLDTGTRKTVFVERGEGRFEPRPVETGWQMGGRVEILRGLAEGERIVVSGNFLVDSESRMQLAAAGIYGAWHIDPVCGMSVDEGKAKAAGKTVEHGGKTYYFCSDGCVGEFRKDPGKYRKEAAPPAKKEMTKAAPAAQGAHERHAAPAGAAPKEHASAESDDLPIDPVCGMVVPPPEAKAAGRVSVHKGKTYYFCADMCKKRFDENPEAFLAKPGQGGMGAGHEGHGDQGKDAGGGAR